MPLPMPMPLAAAGAAAGKEVRHQHQKANLPPISPRLKAFAAQANAARSSPYGPFMPTAGSSGPVSAASAASVMKGGNGPAPKSPPILPALKGLEAPKAAGPVSSSVPWLKKKAAMNDPFLSAFTDEIIKTAAIAPMAKKVKTGATMLGKKVQNLASRVAKRAKGMRAQTKGGTGMKGLVRAKKGLSKKAILQKIAEGDAGDASAQDLLQQIMDEAQARFDNGEGDAYANESEGSGEFYGTGTGPKKRSMTTAEVARTRR